MAPREVKKIGKHEPKVRHLHSNAWEVMKPFVHFGVKATGLIASTLVSIIRSIPKHEFHEEPEHKKNKIIKI